MTCANNRCLASLGWLGHPDDPIIAGMAKERGWRLYEGQGWLCPHHASTPTKKEPENDHHD